MSLEAEKKSLIDAGRRLMNGLIPRKLLMAGYEIKDVKLVLHERLFRQSVELRALVRVLRACIVGNRKARELTADLQILEAAVNKKNKLGLDLGKHGAFCITEYGSRERCAVQDAATYTHILGSDVRLAPFAPIGVCPNCDGIYFRAKRGQEYCSMKCRVAHWSKSVGKDYFAEAQRRRRAAIKKRLKKTVVKSEGELLKKSKETKRKPKTK